MEAFSALLAICAGNSLVTGEFPYKALGRGVLMFSLISAWINGWVNNGKAGDLRRHVAHYDVSVMVVITGNCNHKNKDLMCELITHWSAPLQL